MPTVQGTNVEVTFLTFKGVHPDIYDDTQGKRNVASVNAGNSSSNCLCVGLSGVNGAFLAMLQVTQKRANLSPLERCVANNYDDYQDRHLKLLAKADAGGATWESYSNTDPCAFSYVNPKRISTASGYAEGVCFVDVFDAQLRPCGNPRNVAMLYAAPPFDQHYKTQTAFLAALEAMANNIVKTISGYNGVAAQNGQPVIEVLRNTLYSSGYYNKVLNLPPDDIARAIYEGFEAALNADQNSGLLELQFPVGDAALNQDHPLFAAVQQDLAQVSSQAVGVIGGGVGAVIEPVQSEENNPLEDEEPPMQQTDLKGEDPKTLIVAKKSLTQAATDLFNATNKLDPILTGTTTLPAGLNRAVMENGRVYDNFRRALDPDYGIALPDAIRLDPGPTKGSVKAVSAAARELLIAHDALLKARTLPEARRAVDAAKADAVEALTEASKAIRSAQTPGEINAAKLAEGVALKASRVARAMDAQVRSKEILAKTVFADANGRLRMKVVIGTALGVGGAAVVGTVIGLVIHFVSGGGKESPVPPGPRPIDAGGLDDGNPVTVDIMAQNQGLNTNFDPSVVESVQLVDPATGAIGDTAGTNWATSVNATSGKKTSVTYTPTKGATQKSGDQVSVNYILNYVDPAVPQSSQVALGITFVDNAAPIPAQALKDSTGVTTATFSFPLPPDQFVFTPPSGDWKTDMVNKQLLYTLPTGVATATVSASYSLGVGLPTNSSTLVVLLPPADLPSVTASPTTVMVPFAALPDPGTAFWTLYQSGAAVTSPLTVPEGSWTLTGNQLTFKPNAVTPPAAGSSLSVQFALALGKVVSVPGNAKISFSGNQATMQMDLPAVAKNRTDSKFYVTIPQGIANLQPTHSSTAEGQWAANANQVVFTPTSSTSFTDSAKNSYTATGFAGNITILFPVDIAVDADRQAATSINIAIDNPKITQSFALSVQDTVPAMDGSNGTWTDLTAQGMPGILQFQPPASSEMQVTSGSVLQIPGPIVKEYVMTFAATGATATAKLTLNLTDTFEVYNVDQKASATDTSAPINFLNYCYFPPNVTYGYAKLSNESSGGGWSISATQFTLTVTDSSLSSFTVDYQVFDSKGNPSNIAHIVVTKNAMMMPMAADYLLAKDLWTAKKVDTAGAMDVLSGCAAFYGIDPTSVTLTGPLDLGQDYAAPAAFVETGGKQMRLPGEGCWFVDDVTGMVGFVADSGLTTAPTPVGFRFRDKKGNRSNEGVLVIDTSLVKAEAFQAAMKAMSDKDFWDYFQTNVIWQQQPRLTHDQFVSASELLAGVTRLLGKVGNNPVSDEDFEKAFDAWFLAGKKWHEPSGQEDSACLFSICRHLVEKRTKGTKMTYRTRYWRLAMMAQMGAYTRMLDLVQN